MPLRDNSDGNSASQTDTSVAAKLFSDASNFAGSIKDSFLYSAVQSPVEGAAQLIDQLSGQHLAEKVEIAKPPEAAKFGSLTWYGQQIGSGLGIAADFLVAHKTLGAVAGKLGAGAESLSATSAIGRSALTGAIYQGVFSPSQSSPNNFWLDRLESAGSGALTFGTLTGASIGLRSMVGSAAAESGLVAKIAKSDWALGTAAGIPAGIISAESNSVLHGRGLASKTEALQSAYGFVVAGGALGLLHGLGVPAHHDNLSRTSGPGAGIETQDGVLSKPDLSKPDGKQFAGISDSKLTSEERFPASDHTFTKWDTAARDSWVIRLFDELNIEPKKLDLTRDAEDQISSISRQKLTLKRHSATSDDMVDVTVPCTIIKLTGRSTEIVIPDGAWKNQDEVRERRKLASTMSEKHKSEFDRLMSKSDRLSLLGLPVTAQARYFRTVLPEQLGRLLDELPDQSIVNRVVVWPDSAHTAAADASHQSDINIYNFEKRDLADLRHFMFHEWSHVADNKFANSAFFYAADLEKDGYYARKYARKNTMENLAVHLGEEILSPDADNFFIFTEDAPLRSVALAEILRRNLNNAETNGVQGPYHKQFVDRLNYIDSTVVPIAKAELSQRLRSSEYSDRKNSLLFLDSINEINPQLARQLIDPEQLLTLTGRTASETSGGSQLGDLLEHAKHQTWLNQKLLETRSSDSQTRVWAYESLDHTPQWPIVAETFPKLVAENLAKGGTDALGALEWLGNHPEKASTYLDASRLQELVNDPNADVSTAALSVYFSPQFLAHAGISQAPDMMAYARENITKVSDPLQ